MRPSHRITALTRTLMKEMEKPPVKSSVCVGSEARVTFCSFLDDGNRVMMSTILVQFFFFDPLAHITS